MSKLLSSYAQDGRTRVLVTGPNRNLGGVELVTSRFMSALREQFVFDTLSFDDLLQPEFYSNGNRVIKLPKRGSHPLDYARAVRAFFAHEGSAYRVVWSNINSFGNLDYLSLGKKTGIPVRVCHYHNTAVLGSRLDKALSLMNQRKVPKVSNCLLACSKEAGEFAFGSLPFQVVNNAFDLSLLSYSESGRHSVRTELGCGDSFVIGTVGRLTDQKNQQFLLEIFPRIKRIRSDCKLVFVGAGECETSLRACVADLGIESDVVFAGARTDIASCLSAFDVFAFPSLFEGLGVSAVEAQANGLPCVVSTGVPAAACVSGSIQFISLENSDQWIEALVAADRTKFIPDAKKLGKFDICSEAARLAELFSRSSNRCEEG